MSAHRLFIGFHSGGLVYADRTREENGDYKRLAFLPWHSLALQFAHDCPADLRQRIEADARHYQVRRGQQQRISECGQTVMLGGA